jgi:ubiquitin C-terminal hydrolase
MKSVLPSSKCYCILDLISICNKTQKKKISRENVTLWLQQKNNVVWAESNWSFAVKDVGSIELESNGEFLVLKLECHRKEKVWIGEHLLNDEKCMKTREQHEQQKRLDQVHNFYEVVKKLVEKRKNRCLANKLNPGLHAVPSKSSRKSPPSLSSRKVTRAKYISPTPRRESILTKRKQDFDLIEFSSDDEVERKNDPLNSSGMEDVNPPYTDREEGDKIKDGEELEEPVLTNRNVSDDSDNSSIEVHFSGPSFSKEPQKQRKRLLVLQDDDDAVDNYEMEVNASFSSVLPHSIVEETSHETTLERTKEAVIENSKGASDESPKSGILAFFKPKKVMQATPVAMVSSNQFPCHNKSKNHAASENSTEKVDNYFHETENLHGCQLHAADALENTATERENIITTPTPTLPTKLKCDETSILEPLLNFDDELLEDDQSRCPSQGLKFKPKPFKLRAIRSYQRTQNEEDCDNQKTKELDFKEHKYGFNPLSICNTQQANRGEGENLQSSEHKEIHSADSSTWMVGLRNAGNMCYINAALQMINSLKFGFVQDFLEFCERKGIKKMCNQAVSSPKKKSAAAECANNWESILLPLHHAIASVFYSLQYSPPLAVIQHMSITSTRSGNSISASASCVKRAIDLKTNNFYGNEQRDAHEFLLEILDLLDDEEKQDETLAFHSKGNISRLVTPSKEFERCTAVAEMTLHGLGSDSFKVQKSTTMPKLPIEQYFNCQVEVTLVCDLCGYSRTNIELHRHLSLDLSETAEKEDPWALTKGVENFFKPQTVSIKCSKNNCDGESCTKSHRIANLPGALLLHLKRFEVKKQKQISDKNMTVDVAYIKKKTLVKYPASLSLNKYCMPLKDSKGNPISSFMYELRSVVHHIGDSASRGHYIADALKTIPFKCAASKCTFQETPQMPESESWIRFDDAFIKPISIDVALREPESMRNVYMLLYERGP